MLAGRKDEARAGLAACVIPGCEEWKAFVRPKQLACLNHIPVRCGAAASAYELPSFAGFQNAHLRRHKPPMSQVSIRASMIARIGRTSEHMPECVAQQDHAHVRQSMSCVLFGPRPDSSVSAMQHASSRVRAERPA